MSAERKLRAAAPRINGVAKTAKPPEQPAAEFLGLVGSRVGTYQLGEFTGFFDESGRALLHAVCIKCRRRSSVTTVTANEPCECQRYHPDVFKPLEMGPAVKRPRGRPKRIAA